MEFTLTADLNRFYALKNHNNLEDLKKKYKRRERCAKLEHFLQFIDHRIVHFVLRQFHNVQIQRRSYGSLT